MSGNPPMIAYKVLYTCATITIKLIYRFSKRDRSNFKSSLIGDIDIFDIDDD